MTGQPPSASGRVVAYDALRGLAIVAMVFLHNGAFHLASPAALLASPPPWLVLLGFLLLWAGLFGVVSGAANATATLRRLQRQPAAGGPWRYPRALTAGALQTFAILFLLHWVWTIGVGSAPVPADPHDPAARLTLLPGWILHRQWPRIHPENWVFASALWMIAVNVLAVSLALHWFYRHRPPRRDDGLTAYLLALALLVLLATPVARAALHPVTAALVERGGGAIALAVPLALLVNDPNPVFPFVAYGLLGAAAGAALLSGDGGRRPYRRFVIVGAILVAVGGAGLVASGGLRLADREHIWGQGPLYFSALGCALLGVFTWLLVAAVALLDPGSAAGGPPWRPRGLRALVRFGRASLTVFLLEGVLAAALRAGLDGVRPGWNAAVGAVLLFALGNVLLWHGILVCWERAGYRYSCEWWLAHIRGTDERVRALRTR